MKAALVLLAVGCAAPASSRPFVRDVRVVGDTLVVDKCVVRAYEDNLVLDRCTTQSLPLPHRVEVRRVEVPAAAPALPDTLDRAQVARGIAGARDALRDCGANGDAPLKLRLVIDGRGHVVYVRPVPEDTKVAECATAALATARFPESRRGASLTLSLDSDDDR